MTSNDAHQSTTVHPITHQPQPRSLKSYNSLSSIQRLTPLKTSSTGSVPTLLSPTMQSSTSTSSSSFKSQNQLKQTSPPTPQRPIVSSSHSSTSLSSFARSYSNTDLSNYHTDLIQPQYKKSRPNSPGLIHPPTSISRSPTANHSLIQNRDSSAALHLLGFSTQHHGNSSGNNGSHQSHNSNNTLFKSSSQQTPDATPLQTPSVSPKLGPTPMNNGNMPFLMNNNSSLNLSSSSGSGSLGGVGGLNSTQLPPLRSLKLDLPDEINISNTEFGKKIN
ncbi:hypothetical protein CANARDRAFT_26822, partial [[Candida] arabinofermentans NRRL YB-2248]